MSGCVDLFKSNSLAGSSVVSRAARASHFSLLAACCVSSCGSASPPSFLRTLEAHAATAQAKAKAKAKATAFALCASSFCLGKRNQNRWRLTRAGTAAPPRSPALLGQRGTAPKLATLKQGRLYGRTGLRCSARSTAQVSQHPTATATATATKDYFSAGRVPTSTLIPAFASAVASASSFALAFAPAPALALASLSLKASRAPQADTAAEAPLFERSEFGRRAVSGEERRAPMRLHRIGSRQAQTVLFAASRSPFGPASPFAPQSGAVVPFAKTKGTRASARKLLLLSLPLPPLLPTASANN
jgi:hypothetical protein